MRKLTKIFLLVLLLSALRYPLSAVYATVPHLIGYQGRLTDASGNPREGAHSITFLIYDAEAVGNLLWHDTYNVTVTNGIFDVLLGSGVNTLDLAFDKPYYLAIQVGSDPEMTPRQQLSSVGYAYKADSTTNSDAVDGIHASATPEPNKLVALDTSAKLPISALSTKAQIFTSSGTFTAPHGVTQVFISMCGGGGGGGSNAGGNGGGGGGGGQQVVRYPYAVIEGSDYTVTIGNGGSSESAGGSSAFGSLTMLGGLPGQSSVAGGGGGPARTPNGGSGATAPGGGPCITSGAGGAAYYNTGGGGGGGVFGIGGVGGTIGQAGSVGSGYGAGGGGAGSQNPPRGGSAGSPGFCLVEW